MKYMGDINPRICEARLVVPVSLLTFFLKKEKSVTMTRIQQERYKHKSKKLSEMIFRCFENE